MPLSNILALFCSIEENRRKIQYEFSRETVYKPMYPDSEENTLEDFFDGKIYKECAARNINSNNLYINLHVDAFQPFKNSSNHSMVMVMVTLMNLPPEIRYRLFYKNLVPALTGKRNCYSPIHRYKEENVLILGILPGPNKPYDLFSFLYPWISEIMVMEDKGLVVKTNSNQDLVYKVFLVSVVGDIPGVAELCGHQGHAAYSGCRICTISGSRDNGMHFPSFDSQGRVLSSPIRTKEHYKGTEQVTI